MNKEQCYLLDILYVDQDICAKYNKRSTKKLQK